MEICPYPTLDEINPITIELPDEDEIVGTTEKNQTMLSLLNSTPLEYFVTIPIGNKAQVSIYDINGREVFKKIISSNNQSINLDNLIQIQFGIYIAKIQLENGDLITQKLIVHSK